MSEEFKKIDKEFLITDSTLNVYDFRLMTKGYKVDEFKKNPVGFHLHDDRKNGVLLKWENFRTDGDKVYAKPVVNLSHPRGERTVQEVKNGFLNAASVGMLVALKISEDPKDYLPNQKGPTVLEWYNRECSLVDVPGNYNALSSLCDKEGNLIDLADFTNPEIKIPKMEDLKFTPEQLGKMNLSAASNPADVSKAFNDLVAKAGRADNAEKELKDLKAETTAKEVEAITAKAVADKKATVELANKLKADYSENPEGLKDLYAAMPVYKTVGETLDNNPEKTKLEALMAQDWDALHKAGELENLKALDVESYNKKKLEKYPAK